MNSLLPHFTPHIRKRDSMVNISSKEANRCHQLNMDSQMVQVPELVISFHYYFFIKKNQKLIKTDIQILLCPISF